MFDKLFNLFRKKKKKEFILSKESFADPLYPPDLAEVFDLNRNEIHTDRCTWRKYQLVDKDE